VKKRVLLSGSVAALATLALVIAAASAVAKTASGTKVNVLPSSSCSKVFYQGSGSPQALIASDLPLQGAGRAQPISMTRAIEYILSTQFKFKAGQWTIGYQSCDDSTAQAGGWDPAKCTANGQAYAADKTVIGVIGTFNSGCAKLIIPILNRAGPLGMVSPANTYPGLTHVKKPITAPGEPGIYYPTRTRNYARVVATDDYQGPADAILVKQLREKSVYILNDNQTYGKGIALAFQVAAKKLGIAVKGFEAWDAKASSYEAVASRIKQSGAQAVFLGGIVCNNGGKLVKDLRAGLGAGVTLIGPDGFTPISAVVKGAGSDAEGMYVSVAGYPNEKLGPAGKAFIVKFAKYQKQATVDPYAVYAAQATQILLNAISKSDGTRSSVNAQIFKTKVSGGILGTFAIDRNGDTTLKGITVYKIVNGKGPFNRLIIPPKSLTG
jgi:branched-chain amino acid transport system substrate-binding protein